MMSLVFMVFSLLWPFCSYFIAFGTIAYRSDRLTIEREKMPMKDQKNILFFLRLSHTKHEKENGKTCRRQFLKIGRFLYKNAGNAFHARWDERNHKTSHKYNRQVYDSSFYALQMPFYVRNISFVMFYNFDETKNLVGFYWKGRVFSNATTFELWKLVRQKRQ